VELSLYSNRQNTKLNGLRKYNVSFSKTLPRRVVNIATTKVQISGLMMTRRDKDANDLWLSRLNHFQVFFSDDYYYNPREDKCVVIKNVFVRAATLLLMRSSDTTFRVCPLVVLRLVVSRSLTRVIISRNLGSGQL